MQQHVIKPIFKVIHTQRDKVYADSNNLYYRPEESSYDSAIAGSLTANYEAASSNSNHDQNFDFFSQPHSVVDGSFNDSELNHD